MLETILLAVQLTTAQGVSSICVQVNELSNGRIYCAYDADRNAATLRYGPGAFEGLAATGRRPELISDLCATGVDRVEESRWRPWGRKKVSNNCPPR